jgi:hypothetical protein
MKAIKTKYLGPTNTKGARIKASDGNGNSIIISWDYELDTDFNHVAAAVSLCEKMGWPAGVTTGWHGNEAFHLMTGGK